MRGILLQFQGGSNPFQGGINTVPRWEQSIPRWDQYSSKVGAIQARVGVIHFQGRSETTFQGAIHRTCSSQRQPTLVNPTTLGVGTRVRQRQSRATPAIHDETVYAGCDRAHDCGAKGLS